MPPNTTERAARAGFASDLVSAQGVAGVDADADDVAGLDGRGIERIERLVAEDGIAAVKRRGGGEDVEPPRGDDGHAE